ncbi:dethiobiotin synthase [Hydrogenobaculum acidophilum]
MILFVSATDTGVGKTYVSALLVRYLKSININVNYLKPIETGVEDKPEDAYKISQMLGKPWQETVIYTFKKPMSPYACVLDENKDIDIDKIINAIINLEQKSDILIVEGAGGISVPIKVKPLVDYAFLIKALNAKPLIVARASLGTLNHSFLTYFYLKSKDIKPIGFILNGFDYEEPSQYSNADILKDMIEENITVWKLDKNPDENHRLRLAEDIWKSIANF